MSVLRSATKLTKSLTATFSPSVTSLAQSFPSPPEASGRQISTGRDNINLYKVVHPEDKKLDVTVLNPYLGTWIEDINQRDGQDEFLDALGTPRSARARFNRYHITVIKRDLEVFKIQYAGPGPERGIHKFTLHRYFIQYYPDGNIKTRYFLIPPDGLGLTLQYVDEPDDYFETTSSVVQDTMYWHTRYHNAVLKKEFNRAQVVRPQIRRGRGTT